MTSTTPATTATIASPAQPSQQQQDPNSLLDSLDAFSSNRAAVAAVLGAETNHEIDSATDSAALDPVDFINRHYTTEHLLISQLPSLREAVNERTDKLQERISTALQRQSETSQSTRRHVIDAKQSILSLEKRIRLVQEKAGQSERAVLEITKDMKRLDCAKRHLQKTITTLKQLHMLVNAVEQLRLAALIQPFPDYPSAAQLVDATRLLLQHFESYQVPPMKLLGLKVQGLQQELLQGLLRGFRIAGFGVVGAMELEEGGPKSPTNATSQSSSLQKETKTTNAGSKEKEKNNNITASSSAMTGKGDAKKDTNGKRSILDTSPALRDDSDDENEDNRKSDQSNNNEEDSIPIMTPPIMTDGILLIDALGSDTRAAFILTLCKDHLQSYEDLFRPKVPEKRILPKAHSFKIAAPKDGPDDQTPPYSLTQFERRFAWYRRKLREVNDCYPEVFPVYWNFQYKVTVYFLEMTKTHLLALLEPGQTKDKESDNAQNLLIALQKTILFEKEMMALLQRDFGTVFNLDSDKDQATNPKKSMNNDEQDYDDEGDDDDNKDLEFDEEGNAVQADSAQGIRIKYERRKRERSKVAAKAASNPRIPPSPASVEQVSVNPLVGCASSAFDDHMTPYIALEEQEMDERLVKAVSDSKTDARGEFPVFTSSTDLFVYMKTSINRCKAMTKGKAFFLLHLAFQDSLNKYAQILLGKLPSPTSSSAMGGNTGGLDTILRASMHNPVANNRSGGSSSSSNASHVIPEGEEVTICYIISTCEYCADTIEALEDHISDAIDAEYKDSVDTTVQQENFHDVTAKCLKVLVSGLMTRCLTQLKTISTVDWSIFEHVGEESPYVHPVTIQILPFASVVRGHVPQSYFRSFCDKFATAFTAAYYNTLIKLKKVNEMATQQLLLDIYSLKTCLLKLPVVDAKGGGRNQKDSSTSLAPAMYTKMVTKQFRRIETLLKLVGTPTSMLIEVFKSQWPSGTAMDLQTVMSMKGLKRQEQAQMLEQIGLDSATALKGATMGVTSEDIVQERMQLLRERSTTAVGRVTSDLSQMRQKVDDFRKAFSN